MNTKNFREKGIIGVKIEDGDVLLSASLTNGSRELMIATKMGQSIRFGEEQVRSTGRSTMGVKGIELEEGDAVVGFTVSDPQRMFVLAICEKGYGKRTHMDDFRSQHRGGKGIILIDASDRNGPVVDVRLVGETDEVMLITDKGQTIRTRVSEIRQTGRNAQGVRIMSVDSDERVVAMERLAEQETDDAPSGDSIAPPALPPDGSELN